MKVINFIGHPVLVMSIYLLIMISGEHFGGFYLLYILMGLPNGASHALLATCGLAILLISYKIYRTKPHILKPVSTMLGLSVMVLALITFFENSQGYNDDTFYQTFPLITMFLFALCVFCCIVQSIGNLFRVLKAPKDPLGMVS